ncbi:MAG: response regulator [Caulobacteraceae bacterium]|nr:response regulator [Caulobacteraceae bacterium]
MSPSELVTQAANSLRPQADTKGLELIVKADPSIAPLIGDGGRLRQVVVNLVSNAIKFTDAGAVTTTVTATAVSGAKQKLRISVEDTGIGIAQDQLPSLFTRFSQLDSSPSRRASGSGLGLAVTKSLIELMGGTAGVRSELGRGSMFWIEVDLPVAVETLVRDQFAAAAAIVEPPRCAILVVDDVASNRDLITALLPNQSMDFAIDGAEAVEKVRANRYDIVFMDVQMPSIDGLAATRTIRAGGGNVPIIALTAHVLPAQVIACRAAGMDDHLAKPIDAAALREMIGKWTLAAPRRSTAPEADPLGPLRQEFVARAREDLHRISELLADSSADRELQFIVHRIAGAAAVFGYPAAGRAALVADQAFEAGKRPSLEELQAVMDALNQICEAVAA